MHGRDCCSHRPFINVLRAQIKHFIFISEGALHKPRPFPYYQCLNHERTVLLSRIFLMNQLNPFTKADWAICSLIELNRCRVSSSHRLSFIWICTIRDSLWSKNISHFEWTEKFTYENKLGYFNSRKRVLKKLDTWLYDILALGWMTANLTTCWDIEYVWHVMI